MQNQQYIAGDLRHLREVTIGAYISATPMTLSVFPSAGSGGWRGGGGGGVVVCGGVGEECLLVDIQ